MLFFLLPLVDIIKNVVPTFTFFSEDTPKKSKKKRERTPDPTDPVVIAERAAEHTAEALAEAEARAKAEEESKPSKIEECKYYTSLTLGKYKICNPHPESQI